VNKIDSIITGVLRREGAAFTNDLRDSGGPTKYGITQRALSQYLRRPAAVHEVEALTETQARAVYLHQYVEAPGFGVVLNLSDAIAAELVDTGVNSGPANATMLLQRALNALNRCGKDYPDIAEDGDCGPGTVAALRAFLQRRGHEGETVLLRALNGLQTAFYIDLARRRPKDEEFVYGWLRTRVA
jgi:lysozyme family protein